jgi:hypothetical protein
MTSTDRPRGKHLLTDDELASHAGATADDLIHGHRDGNGFRVHTIYIVIVSVAALAVLVGGIALASMMK